MNIDFYKIYTSAGTTYALLLIVFFLMWIAFYRKPSRKKHPKES